jgi:hypothetical protein
MRRPPVRSLLRIGAVLVCLSAAGCAGRAGPYAPAPGSDHVPTSPALAPEAAAGLIALGQSSKAEVESRLGKALVIAFDSGYEVWVYRWRGADGSTRGAPELVLLFEPAGRATKLRLRPGYPAPP